MTEVILVTEDDLSTAVASRLLEELGSRFSYRRLGNGGFGYIKKRISAWCELACHRPVFVLTDLDNKVCPLALISDWFGNNLPSEKLLFRVAVREVEAWLLADHSFMREIIGKSGSLSLVPESLPDPKAVLLRLIHKHAKRQIRDDIVRKEGNNLRQGVNYNDRLVNLVCKKWDPARASKLAPSLRRARLRMRKWAGKL